MSMYDDDFGDDAPDAGEPIEPTDWATKLGEVEGDVSDLLDDSERAVIGQRVAEEWQIDRASRADWDKRIERALKASVQDDAEKSFPWVGASNVKHPMLLSAAVQFGSRSYGALVREKPVKADVIGADPEGRKKSMGERVAAFTNAQLLYTCDEWEPGTDALCHMLPIMGTAFRKVYWSRRRNRPVLDTVSARHVYVPNDTVSLDQAPRVTQLCTFYPYEIAERIAIGSWRDHEYRMGARDTQAPVQYIEQYRYEDLDRDGLPEPYVATIHLETRRLVHLEPAFDPSNLRVNESGAGDALVRDMPWIDYGFLPDMLNGGFYSLGFGHILEPLQAAINAMLNQIIDAGTRQNAGGGFISSSLKLRAGTLRLRPGEYHQINHSGPITQAIEHLQFPGPSPTMLSSLEFLLGAAEKLTATADVLSGELPGGQRVAEGTVLALIEQGMQVHSTIFKRMYRSERRTLRRLFGLNRDFVSPTVYQKVLDARADPRSDFDAMSFDVVPVSDPSAITDAQRLARAQLLAARAQAAPQVYDPMKVEMRLLEAARIPNAAELLQQGPNPQVQIQQELAQAQIAEKRARASNLEAGAAKAFQDAQGAALERGVRTGELTGLVGGPGGAGVPPGANNNVGGGQGPVAGGELGGG